ncbi:uncharacterized protein LOC142172009 [Nicotiana tabacum]|uniref:Uncharacterized protein LOC142172009 n=1 Tax=Nicotiana tabacum TaxID=4097 RepID=A0AC58T3Q5_TOBAC
MVSESSSIPREFIFQLFFVLHFLCSSLYSTVAPETPLIPAPQTSTRNGVTLDDNHPYFLHSLYAPGMSLVNAVFDGRGYQGWKRSVLIALSAKSKLGFIDGTCPAPAIASKDYQPWSRCNDMVISWLLNSLSKDIGDSVIYSKTTKELWTGLEHRFGQSNEAKLYYLQKELAGLVQGTSDIATYFIKLKCLWDELDSLNTNIKCTCTCICEGKKVVEKSQEDQRLIQFLMGWNEAYGQARGTILIMNPLPNINHAYSLILQDENQKEFQKPANGFQKSGSPPQMKSVPKARKGKFNPNVSCTYCKKIDHSVADCYRIIGFPYGFEFTNGKQGQGPIRGNGAFSGDQGDDLTSNEVMNQHLSREQFSQLVQLIKQVKVTDAVSSNSEINANAVAGTIIKYSGSCFQFTIQAPGL